MLNNKIVLDKQLRVSDRTKDAQDKFNRHIIHKNAKTISDVTAHNFDINKATQISQNALSALDAKDSLQSMLAAQILSIHDLQQKSYFLLLSKQKGDHRQEFVQQFPKFVYQ